jgi:hypothetical protein
VETNLPFEFHDPDDKVDHQQTQRGRALETRSAGDALISRGCTTWLRAERSLSEAAMRAT